MSTGVKVGVWLSSVAPRYFVAVAQEAERLGYESVWMSEHLILPMQSSVPPSSGAAGAVHSTIDARTPTFDALGYLSYLAGVTKDIRLGTWVYLLGLRHPFVSARAVQTLDLVSGGRVELGVGAGWLAAEWDAMDLPFVSRGRRLADAVGVCRRLWAEESVAHESEFYRFEAVGFEPKPCQRPGPPVHFGGESSVALRRAAALGDGWVGMQHTPESAARLVTRLADLGAGTTRPEGRFEYTVGGSIESAEDCEAWDASGVSRVIVSPWRRSSDALSCLQRLAEVAALPTRASLRAPGSAETMTARRDG